MKRDKDKCDLPKCAIDYIGEVVRKVRYRKKIRADVRAELIGHFEDALKDCKTDDDRCQSAEELITEFGDPKMLAKLIRRGKKRCRPMWKKVAAMLFQVTGIFIVVFGLYTWWFYSGKAVISIDYTVQLNGLVKGDVDSDENATVIYDQAISLYVKPSQEVSSLEGPVDKLDAEQRRMLSLWVEANHDCIEKYVLASKKKYIKLISEAHEEGLNMVVRPNLSEMKKVCQAIAWRAKLRSHRGEIEGAFEDVLVCYRAGLHMWLPTSLIEQLVGMSMINLSVDTAKDIIRDNEIDEAVLSGFIKSFSRLVASSDYKLILDGEILAYYDEVQRSFTPGSSGHLIPKRHAYNEGIFNFHIALISNNASNSIRPQQKRSSWQKFVFYTKDFFNDLVEFTIEMSAPLRGQLTLIFAQPRRDETVERMQEMYRLYDIAVEMSPYDLANSDIIKKIETQKGNSVFLEIASMPCEHISSLSYRTKANVRGFQATVASMLYEKQNGAYPESLRSLIDGGYMDKVPQDPFSDGPLVYRKTDDGFMLYSVGLNMIDDDGVVGERKWDQQGDAVFWPIGD